MSGFVSKKEESLQTSCTELLSDFFWPNNLNWAFSVQNRKKNSLRWSFCTTSHSLTSTPWSKWVVCMTWQEQRPYLFGNLCVANTASYHPSSTRLMRTLCLNRVKDCYVCELPAGLLALVAQIILMRRLFLQLWKAANKADPCLETLAWNHGSQII